MRQCLPKYRVGGALGMAPWFEFSRFFLEKQAKRRKHGNIHEVPRLQFFLPVGPLSSEVALMVTNIVELWKEQE